MTRFPSDAILVVVETEASGELEGRRRTLRRCRRSRHANTAGAGSHGAGSAAAAEAAGLGATHVLIAETPILPRSACRALTRLPPPWSRCTRTQS